MTGALKFFDGTSWNTVGVGPPGPAGAAGAAGPTGATGQWFTYTGSGTPPAGTFAGEKDGDMAARSSDSEVFKRVSGAWVDQGYALGYAMNTAARAYRAAAQTTTASAYTKIALDTITGTGYDVGNNFLVATGRYVAPVAGYYQVNGNVGLNGLTANTDVLMLACIYVNGVQTVEGVRQTRSDLYGAVTSEVNDVVKLNAGDYVELWAYSSGAWPLQVQNLRNYLSVVRVDVSGRPGAGWKQYTGSATPSAAALPGNAGDMAVRTSDGEVFQMVSGAWVDQGWSLLGANMNATYAARAYRSGPWTTTSGTQLVPIDTKSYDPGNNIAVGSARYVCPVSGYYHVEGSCTFGGQTSGSAQLMLYKNGGTATGGDITGGSAGGLAVSVTDTIQCNAGDYLQLYVWIAAAGYVPSLGAVFNYLAVSLVTATAIQAHPLQPASQARAYRNAAFTPAASTWVKVPLDTVSFDAGNNIQLANSRYVAPTAGYYQVDAQVNFNSGNPAIALYVNGALYDQGVTGSGPIALASDTIRLNAGDYVEVYCWINPAVAMVVWSGSNYLAVSLVGTIPTSAPAHAARMYRAAAFTPAANTWTKIPLDSANFDPGGNFQTANGRYVCPVAGVYDVVGTVELNESTTGTYTNTLAAIYKNGVQMSYVNTFPAVQNVTSVPIADKIQCNAGDYLELWLYNTQGTALVVASTTTWMAVSLLTGSQIGPPGASGPRGTQWFIYNGTGTPAPGSFGGELDGDWAIRKVDGENFQRVGGVWVDQGFTNRSTAIATSARMYRNAAQSLATGWTKINLDTVTFDSASMTSVANGRMIAPTSGYYHVDGACGEVAAAVGDFLCSIYVNGLERNRGSRTTSSGNNNASSVAGMLQLNAGDYVELYAFCMVAVNLAAIQVNNNYLSLALITAGPGPAGPQGPQGVPGNSADAKTAARAYRAAALTTAAAAFSKIPIDTLSYDAGTNMQIASGRYVAPVSGYYHANGEVAVSGNASTDCLVHADLYVNGALAVVGSVVGRMDASGYARPNVSDVLRLNAGDYVELWTYTSAAFALFVGGASAYNYLSVVKVDVGGPPGPQGPQGIPGGVGNTGARAYRNAALTLTAGSAVKIPVDTISRDTNGHISGGRYNVTSAGWYQVDGMTLLGTGGANQNSTFVSFIYLNGAQVSVGLQMGNTAANTYISSTVSDLVYCVPGDYLELWAYCSSAWALVIGAANNYLSVAQVDQAGPQGPPGGAANQVANPYAIVQGYTADRSFSPALTSLGEVANVLATLIDDMKNAGLIKP